MHRRQLLALLKSLIPCTCLWRGRPSGSYRFRLNPAKRRKFISFWPSVQQENYGCIGMPKAPTTPVDPRRRACVCLCLSVCLCLCLCLCLSVSVCLFTNGRPSNSEHPAAEQPRTLSDTATTNTERPGNRDHRPTEHSRPPTDRATANTERPGNREHRATKQTVKRWKQASTKQAPTKQKNHQQQQGQNEHQHSYQFLWPKAR